MKIAVLSNVNMNGVIRMLGKTTEVYQTEGYGNELGVLANPDSTFHAFDPKYIFMIIDLMEILGHEMDPAEANGRIGQWFEVLEKNLRPGRTYYISDAYLWGIELSVTHDPGKKAELEMLWQNRLKNLCKSHSNVRILPYRGLIEKMGEENVFSMKMWYMGKILLTNECQRRLCALIQDRIFTETRIPKKVLLLDLDNTLWGGLAGENEHTPVELSEEHGGLAYKNLQRVILQMQKQGVLLAVVSKNNEGDALEILRHHPHMLLRPDHFAAMRINWCPKYENIKEIAQELNLGIDSFVFWDDEPSERQLIKRMLPQVEVPDFPDRPEDLAPAMSEIYREYFAKPAVTEEDRKKTAQYAANASRKQLQETVGNYEDYLRELKIVVFKENPHAHIERLTQLVNKTNQFNLTTRRYAQNQIEELVDDKSKRVFLYRVADRFGDNGIVAAAVVDCASEIPVIEELVMSCRVMGKNIEYALIEDIERELHGAGYSKLHGIYLPTPRNAPVAELYERLGYTKIAKMPQGGAEYEIFLEKTPKRLYYVEMRKESK